MWHTRCLTPIAADSPEQFAALACFCESRIIFSGQKNTAQCQNVKPWSFELNGEKYVVPVADRHGEPLIKSAYQETNNKAHRDFSKTVATAPRYISFEHKAKLDKYIAENGCTAREAMERAIDLLIV